MTKKSSEPIVLIETEYGDVRIKLYNETPIHRDNFLKHVNDGYYNGKSFHRIIKDFMIQGGDISGKKPDDTTPFGETDTIQAEILFPKYFHKKGAVAAARWGDDVNPTMASDAYQFYIVTGKNFYLDSELDKLEEKKRGGLIQRIYGEIQTANMDTLKILYRNKDKEGMESLRASWRTQAEEAAERRKSECLFTDEQRKVYKSAEGGTPFLDGLYSVFGEVTEGMDVVNKIQDVKTNEKDAPLKPVIIRQALVVD